ncbi:uncharacterized protein EV422DRAFT_548872 [Fimicolochytrium jonesii]|uniref:uncharacterized protein n=1 Tax=Fimicolochytrium jonesii TaxID=1396493 RepID=UPI0022FE9ACA|nr:uncharacterized protein EV422DRAFT_548872 [Fimicolochytrium jonesii]KAI8815645.1 hypothetical protein EV422DRAFT_548872 [Fimicolochytrium jonesii]
MEEIEFHEYGEKRTVLLTPFEMAVLEQACNKSRQVRFSSNTGAIDESDADVDTELCEAVNGRDGSLVQCVITPGPWIGALAVGRYRFRFKPKIAFDAIASIIAYVRSDIVLEGIRESDVEVDRDMNNDRSDREFIENLGRTYAASLGSLLDQGLQCRHKCVKLFTQIPVGRINLPRQSLLAARFTGPVRGYHCIKTSRHYATRANTLLLAGLHVLLGVSPDMASIVPELRSLASQMSHMQIPHVFQSTNAATDLRQLAAEIPHYRRCLGLVETILCGDVINRNGPYTAPSYLLNMNDLFENFVAKVISDVFRKTVHAVSCKLCDGKAYSMRCDERVVGGAVMDSRVVQPDVVIWEQKPGGCCKGVVDVKYKHLRRSYRAKKADWNQMLAQVTVAKCSVGVLIYAGEGECSIACDNHANRKYWTLVIDVTKSLPFMLSWIQRAVLEIFRLEHLTR